jgi:ABC-type transporter Mla MlaB component
MKQSKRKRAAAVDIDAAPTPSALMQIEPVAVLAQAPLQVSQAPAANVTSETAKRCAMSVYKLAASCTVRDCAPLKMALSDLMPVESEAVLDVSAIERIDTAVLQLLYAFVRDRKALNRKVAWQGNSECFLEAVQILGMSAHLDVKPSLSATL